MATEHYIPSCLIGLTKEEVQDEFMPVELASRLTDYFDANPDAAAKLKRGDTISPIPKAERYRNTGVSIWNGEKVIPLDYSIDEYGSVPQEFKITDSEFSFTYWLDVIAHNSIIWPDMKDPEFHVEVGDDGDVVAWATVSIGAKKTIAHVDYPEEWNEKRKDGLQPGSAEAFKADFLAGRMLCCAAENEHPMAKEGELFLMKRYDPNEYYEQEDEEGNDTVSGR